MFGFSITKIVFTIALVFVVFWIYRRINVMTDGSESRARVKKDKTAQKEQTAAGSAGPSEVEDLSACPACGAYVARGSNPGCGRPAKDCPMQS